VLMAPDGTFSFVVAASPIANVLDFHIDSEGASRVRSMPIRTSPRHRARALARDHWPDARRSRRSGHGTGPDRGRSARCA
jgi:hypothetical protein